MRTRPLYDVLGCEPEEDGVRNAERKSRNVSSIPNGGRTDCVHPRKAFWRRQAGRRSANVCSKLWVFSGLQKGLERSVALRLTRVCVFFELGSHMSLAANSIGLGAGALTEYKILSHISRLNGSMPVERRI